MTETPADVLVHRLGKLADSGMLDGDYTSCALDIDQELQEKFVFIPVEEIEYAANEIEERKHYYKCGSGPEEATASKTANPNWAYNMAVNALALHRHLTDVEKKLADERPKPGHYLLQAPDATTYTRVTDDHRILVLQRMGGLVDMTESYLMVGKDHWKLTPIEDVEVLF